MTRMPPLAFGLLLTCTLLATVRGQQSIVSTNTISPGGKFTVTCDANKATTPSGVLSVQQLTISRNLTSSNSYSTIAQYRSLSPPGLSKNVTNIPAGRNWTFTFSGDNNGASGNAASMRIVWDVNDASCKDAGIYRCQIDYNLNTGLTTTVFAPDQNVTATTGLSNFALKVDPYNYYDYAVDDNVTFTCSVVGPATGVTFKWVLWVKDQYQSLPANNEIVPKPPTFQTGNTGCVQYNWTSMLRIQVPADYDQQTYKCIVTYLQQQESGNLTIGTTGERPSNVSTNTINSGGRFSIYCDASRASIPHNVYSVRALSIYRDVTSDNSFSTFFKYTSDVYFSSPATECPPRWRCTYTGVNSGINNTATMKIVLDVEKTMCSDSGTYRCVIDYILTNGSLPSVPARDQVIRVTPGLSNFSLTVDLYNYYDYTVDDNVTFTCSVVGPATGVTFKWVLWVKDQYQSLPANNEIVPKPPTFQTGNTGCVQYNWTSMLRIQVPANYDQQTYKCIVTYLQQQESGNLTIGTTGERPSNVSTNTINSGGRFSIYCDASRASIPHNVYSVRALSIYRDVTSDNSFSTFFKYTSDVYFSSPATECPPRWRCTYTGVNSGINNTATMKIVLDVEKTMCSDSGTYRCVIDYILTNGSLPSVPARDQVIRVTRSHPSIVSINSVPADGTFSIYCDASRADAPEAGVRSVQSLSMYKDTQGGSSALVALYNSINPPLFNANAKKIPYGSDWNITFSGDNHGSNNIATMKIVVDVNEVKYSDAGVYRCQIGYYLTVGGFTSVLAPDQKVMVLSKGQSSIVSTNSLTLGGTFVVYCDASRHDILHYLSDVYIYSVQTLSIYRMMETDSSYSLIALYNSVNPDFSADFKNIPAGRDWNITFSGGNDGSNNTATMKIVWEVNDVMFSDAGMYRCQIGYYLKAGGLTSVLAPDQNVTVSGFCSG